MELPPFPEMKSLKSHDRTVRKSLYFSYAYFSKLLKNYESEADDTRFNSYLWLNNNSIKLVYLICKTEQ